MGACGLAKGVLAGAVVCGRDSVLDAFPKALSCCGAPKGPEAEGWPNVGAGIEGLPKVEDAWPKLVPGRPSVEAWPKAEGWLG